MTSIFDIVLAFFQEKKWRFTQLEAQTVLQMSVSAHGTQWNCFADVKESRRQFVFYSVHPFLVSVERKAQVAEFITRANYGLIVGNFEMDFDDGEIRFKSSIDVGYEDLTSQLVEKIVDANVQTMARYLSGISAVNEGASPADTITGIETGGRSGD